MAIVKQAVLHIFDFETGMHIFSQQLLDLSDEDVSNFITKQLEHIHSDLQTKPAEFDATSSWITKVNTYRSGQQPFLTFAQQAATNWIDEFKHCDTVGEHDFLVVEYLHDNEVYLGMILLTRKTAYTHHVFQDSSGTRNEIIRHQAILPNASQKPSTYASVNLAKGTVYYRDRRRVYDGEKRFVLPECILLCVGHQSPKETLKIVNVIAKDLAIEHEIQPSIALAKVKQCVTEAAVYDRPIEPERIAQAVFEQNPMAQREFTQHLLEQDVPKQVVIAPKIAERTGKMHTIKTDMGIEIKVPSEVVSNADYIEFINQPDGTISIQLRNISKIIDR
ncbi:MAG: nucleoid-associated protein [Culicoidibacterales bacterium]